MSKKLVVLIILIVTLISLIIGVVIYAQKTEEPESNDLPADSSMCEVAGCSSELCVTAGSGEITNSICLWKEEYVCLKSAKCEQQQDQQCGWTYTDEYNECIANLLPQVDFDFSL